MFKASLKLFTGSLLGKLVGIVREVLLAGLFGTSGEVAAFRAAQSATLIPINFFTSDSLSAGFLPLYSRYQIGDRRSADALFWCVAALLTLASLVIVVILVVGAPYWVGIVVPGFGPHARTQTVEFARVMGAGVPFYISGSLFSYLEIGHGGYFLASIRATFQSVGMIAGTVMAYALGSPALLAWGFTAAYVAYSCLGAHRGIAHGWFPTVAGVTREDIKAAFQQFWRVVKPLVLLPVLLQGNIVAERAVASILGTDVTAALDYAKFITDTGILLIAAPLGMAGLATLSQMGESQSDSLLAKLLPGLLIVTVPISAGLALQSHLVIATIYEHGQFNSESTRITQTILTGFAAGFWCQVASYVLMKALSAKLRNLEVFRFMAVALVVSAIINVGLFRLLGPVVLGISGACYGLVLLILSARVLGLLRLLVGRLAWLGIGTLFYSLVVQLLPGKGWWAVFMASMVFLAFWGIFLMVVPVLRADISPYFVHMRRNSLRAIER